MLLQGILIFQWADIVQWIELMYNGRMSTVQYVSNEAIRNAIIHTMLEHTYAYTRNTQSEREHADGMLLSSCTSGL